MSHARQQIRAALATSLAGLTGFGTRIYTSRKKTHVTLPDITIYTTEDGVDHEQDADGKEMHILTAEIEIREKVNDALDDTLDGHCAAVEKKIMTNAALIALVKYKELENSKIEITEEAEKPVGLATITYSIWYRVSQSNPETIVS